jgi:gliding motility-associated-like protein
MEFTNTSTIIPGTVYIWNFGDGSAEIVATDTFHTYLASGNYSVTLKAISSTGGIDSVTKTVQVYPRSVPDFTFNNICEGATAHFSNRTTPTNLSLTYEWDLGNGQVDTRSDPESIYDLAGSYVIKLKSTTSDGCADSVSKPITVYPLPVADFTVEDVPYQQPSIFFNMSAISYGNLSYIWDFNDGNTSDTVNPVHIYEAPGVYSVELTAVSDSGCMHAIEKEVKIFALPVAKFTFGDVCIGDTMNFVNESTIPSGTLRYEWDFDNTQTSEDTDPGHLYQLPGEYNVRLICISDKNARDTVYHLVKVFDLPQVGFSFNEACDGYTTSFENISLVSDGEIESVLWDFGDGSNSVQMNPDKDFLNPKIYSVSLEVVSSTGCINTETKDVIVHPNPVTDFEAEDVCFGSYTEFYNSSTIDNTYRPYTLTYTWNFSDGSNSTAKEPVHKYASPGIYEVKLYTQAGACIDSLIRYIEVYSLPEAYAGEDTTVTKGFPINLEASGGIFYEWMPPEGLSNITVADPIARPMETTVYTLRVTDENNCVNFDTILVSVEDELRIIPSNILTPNNNDENDTWSIVNIDSYPNAEIKIFDRWGKLIFEMENYMNDWQGTNSNGDILPDGTYYYIILLSKEHNKIYKGAITILRDK